MAQAISEAKKALGLTSPNPMVGAILVHSDKVIGRGYHRQAGSAHAEVCAIESVDGDVSGATLYTTLEPCDHHGRTGPCTQAIIRAGIKRVVVGTIDPNPKVRRSGLRALRKAGVEVETGVLEDECRTLNTTYNFAIVNQRPWVLLKSATSLDGRIATRTGHSQWITSRQARARGREFRSEMDGICVGISTVLADDPALTARMRGRKDPVRIVLDSTLRIPMKSKLVKTAGKTRTVVASTRKADKTKRLRLEKAGVEVMVLRQHKGGVDLTQLLDRLYQTGLNSLLVEGGAMTHGSFVDAGLVDSVAMFLAPKIIGGVDAPSGVGGRGIAKLEEALKLVEPKIEYLGPDILVLADVHRK